MKGVGMPGPDDDLTALLDTVLDAIPAPAGDAAAPLQALVTNLDASRLPRPAGHRPGRQRRAAQGRHRGPARRGGRRGPAAAASAGSRSSWRSSGIGRAEVDELAAGDLFVVAGFPEVEIGDTIAAPDDAARRCPASTVDEPVLRMTFGVNTCPLAGQGRPLPHVPPPARAPGPRGARQRVDPHRGDRLARRDRGGRPGRAAAGRAHRVDAPGGLRAPGQPARGGHQGDRRPPPRAARAGRVRRARRARRHGHPGPRPPQGPGARPAPRRPRPHHRHVRGAGAGPHRVPLAAAHRHAGHGAAPPAPRRLDAVGRRAAPPHRRGHAGRPARATPPPTPSTTCRLAASCSSARATSSTRAWWSASRRGRATWW